MEKDDLIYTRCPNCGKFFINLEKNPSRFCSPECKTYYKTCINCGKYFVSVRNDNTKFCSPECGTNPEYLELKEQELQPDYLPNLLEETLDHQKESLLD